MSRWAISAGLGLATGLLAVLLVPYIERVADKLTRLVDRLVQPYDFTRDLYFNRDFAKKAEKHVVGQVGHNPTV